MPENIVAQMKDDPAADASQDESINSTPSAPSKPTDQSAQEDLRIARCDVPLVMEYIHESNENLNAAKAALLMVRNNPKDIKSINTSLEIFHNLKGVANFLNLRQIGSLAQPVKNLLDRAYNREIHLAGPSLKTILEAVDLMKQMIHSLLRAMENDQPVKNFPQLQSLVNRLTDYNRAPSVKPASPKN